MAVSDLTGYTWVGNSGVSIDNNDTDVSYNLNFRSNNTDYEILRYAASGYCLLYRINSSDVPGTIAYRGDIPRKGRPSTTGTWSNSEYKTIQITGGTDATNPDLIAWLEANGTLTAPAPAEPLTSSFNETSVVDNSAYLSLYINGVEFKLEKGTASVSLISFYVNPTTVGEVAGYQAESGMTWAEWVASTYNTDGFFVSYNAIYVGPYVVKSDFNGPLVVPTDEIISNKTYYLVSGGNVD